MAVLFSARYLNTLIKLFSATFVICGFSLIYINNSGVMEEKPTRLPYTVNQKIKHILIWSPEGLDFVREGNFSFIRNNCKYTNCFVTGKDSYLNMTDFDAVAFNGMFVIHMNSSQMPKNRSPKQKYIFGGTESPDRFPACNKVFDDFFNWTWTYKLNSDFRYGYITIYDLEGNEVGPSIDMKWPENMKPISEDLKAKLSSKSKAAAWFVSNCQTNSKREVFVSKVNDELKRYGWNVDVYGACGKLKCPLSKSHKCEKKVEEEYFFYFAFENSFAEDYVSEKLLTALNNYAVPVVFGGANYSRFLPPDTYLDARALGPKNLAHVINDLITDKDKFYSYFRWRNHFIYRKTIATADICKLCEVLNDDQMVTTISVWKNFRKWWNGGSYEKNCLNHNLNN